MPAGILIVNQFGTTLIDENYSNLCVRQSGNASVDTNGVMNPNIVAPWAPSYPMLVVGGNHSWRWGGVFLSGGQANGYAISEATGAWYTTPYWFFDVPAAVPPSGHGVGLVVYKADGTVAFDAMQKYARIVDVKTGATYASGGGTYTYPAGRTYGLCIMKTGMRTWQHTVLVEQPNGTLDTGTQQEHWSSLFTLSNNVLTIGQTYWVDPPDMNGGSGINRNVYSTDWAVAVVDVTGY